MSRCAMNRRGDIAPWYAMRRTPRVRQPHGVFGYPLMPQPSALRGWEPVRRPPSGVTVLRDRLVEARLARRLRSGDAPAQRGLVRRIRGVRFVHLAAAFTTRLSLVRRGRAL